MAQNRVEVTIWPSGGLAGVREAGLAGVDPPQTRNGSVGGGAKYTILGGGY